MFCSDPDFQSKTKEMDNTEVFKQFDKWIAENDVVLFMKGTKKMPQCGFSNYVVQIFKFYGLTDYMSVNVLESPQIREGIKKYSNWPTIPQIYIKKEFIGGCDILKEMHADGSLETLLVKEKIIKPK